jgi:hypothetical protein
MNWKTTFAFCFGAAILWISACDTSAPRRATDSQIVDGPQGFNAAILLSIEGEAGPNEPLCTGEIVSLTGFNFSPVLSENRVLFSAGNAAVEGLLLNVRIDRPTGGASAPLRSVLQVLAPGGISSGNLELFVRGQSAGAAGYDACPVITAVTLGNAQDLAYLEYSSILGSFTQGASRVTVHGLNLDTVQEATLSDESGNTQRIQANTFIRNLAVGGAPTPGVLPTGYDVIGFNLRDPTNNVRLPLSGARASVGVQFRGLNGTSNRVEFPVTENFSGARGISAVINSVKVPSGVVTGPVRIHYTTYETFTDAAWTIEVEFSVDNGSTWFSAKPATNDPEHDGKSNQFLAPSSSMIPPIIVPPSRHRLLPARGAFRTFVWDACGDPNFRLLNASVIGGQAAGRDWRIHFRIRPLPETNNRTPINHAFETPPILYFDLADRAPVSFASQREAQLVETFDDDRNKNRSETTASWGPPFNQGALVGTTNLVQRQFGAGLAVVELRNLTSNQLPGGEDIIDQFFLIDTDRMTFDHHLVLAGDFLVINPVRFRDGTGPGARDVGNPGEPNREFHFASLRIEQGVVVRATGTNPAIIRLSGRGDDATDTEVVFSHAGLINLNGALGGNGDATTAGAGGAAGAGGGAGGRGASLAGVQLFYAEQGQNDGGEGGESPLAFRPPNAMGAAVPTMMSGGAGGGGGHRVAGGEGETGGTALPEFRAARSGRGGVARGGVEQLPLTNGSGGGGGGVSSNFTATGQTVFGMGGGGGGSGGTFAVVARGSVQITGEIQANGGKGGDATIMPAAQTRPGAAGGGGSGGTIFIQASGFLNLSDCANLQVRGGTRGVSGTGAQQNRGGIGAAGWIRLESGLGGTPFCSSLMAQTALTGALGSTANTPTIMVGSTAGFPDSGVLIIDDEEIAYGGKSATDFNTITRAVNGTRLSAHVQGAIVNLKGAFLPRDPAVLVDGGVTASPDAITFGTGRDRRLHLRFIQSFDPATGEPLRDASSGQPISVWILDTETSELEDPTGRIIVTNAAATRPGFLDLNQLIIDEGVILRALGPNPLQISVREVADIAGTIDVSGTAGGELRFQAISAATPLPGIGGLAGAGGGLGGSGGTIRFLDGNPNNKVPGNIHPIDGESGGVPAGTEQWDRTELIVNGLPQDRLAFPEFGRSTGGASRQAQACGGECTESAGGGGAGGNLRPGANGAVIVLPSDPPAKAAELIGRGGTVFGTSTFRFGGGLFLRGGLGGAGGGANPHVSSAYASSRIIGLYPLKGAARFAPGTGGGGGGGALHLSAANLILRSGARLLARGGDAYQSIDLGGNGGAGAGGNILIQVAVNFTLQSGVLFDVRGGRANLLPPRTLSGSFVYEGNIRERFADAVPSATGTPFGGLGGDGSPGRVRLEGPAGSALTARGINESISAGAFLRDVVVSTGISRPLRIGLTASRSASSHAMQFGAPRIALGTLQQAPGSSVVVLWESARESLDVFGTPGRMLGLVRDPRDLRDREFVSFRAFFRSNAVDQSSQSITEIVLPYRLECRDQ